MKRRSVVLLLLAMLLLGVAAYAQDSKKESQLRTVRGVVVDKSESAVQGGVVFLKNLRTNQVSVQWIGSECRLRSTCGKRRSQVSHAPGFEL